MCHLVDHNVLKDVVGLLWVVSYVGIRRVVYQTIGDASPTRWGRASPSASELSARQPQLRMGRCATSTDLVHYGGMMCWGGGVKEDRIGAGGDYSYIMRTCTSINDGGCRSPTAAAGPHSRLLSIHLQQSTSILCDRTSLLKLEKVIIINFI